jgi:uncharacterized protein YcnI
MRVALLRVLAVSTCLTLTAAGAAWAHSTVSPEEVPAGSSETFTVTVPGEKEDVAIIEERVDVPQGFEVTDVSSPSGWQGEVEGGSVVWSGGEINLDKEQEFTFEARTPQEPGEYAFRLFDTYEDGSVSRWTGAEDSDNPASVIRVVSDGSQGGFGGAASHEAGGGGHHGAGMATEDLPDTGGIDPILLYGVFSVGALALVGTGLVLLRTTRP